MKEVHAATELSSDGEVPLSMSIVEKVAAHKGIDPLQIEPIYDVIDPDALDAIVNSADSRDDTPLQVEFEYSGCTICVTSGGDVDIRSAA